MKAEKQVPISVYYKEQPVGKYYADILVEDKVIIELKTVEKVKKIHEAQIFNYLKANAAYTWLTCKFQEHKG